jgi:hypothetical protein
MNINKYRGLCRQLIYACVDPQLTPTRKHVLLALVDHVNDREDYTAWPSFDRLAELVGTDRRTTIRAVNIGRKLGIVERIYRGGMVARGGASNRYRFCINVVSGQQWKLVSGETPLQSGQSGRTSVRRDVELVSGHSRTSVRPDTLSSKEHLNNNLRESAASSSSALRAVVVGAADSLTTSDNQSPEQAETSAKGVGEGVESPVNTSDSPKAEPARRQTIEEFRAEMSARGLNMGASRWGRGREVPR